VSQDDLNRAVQLEFKENEIFPKSDAVEDWLMLLDQRPKTSPTSSRSAPPPAVSAPPKSAPALSNRLASTAKRL
jgi:hypothetical protein